MDEVRKVDIYSNEYREYEKAFKNYHDAKVARDKYRDLYRFSNEKYWSKLSLRLHKELPTLARKKREAWYAVMMKVREEAK
ncbi:hypothetical protein BK703_16795 [Bacillus thuringiensis serovar silo]|uniref:hypothetical protein n=1 Tax=Bacillus thuringiensis TaxID=1428 RepID=UPI000A39AF2A|nr:hypothetical protein [Bacillus thuringiensis]MED3275413.1 hypothetical protein [Bacillus thuringiensis]OTW55296.1 hypothetical protein BK703_16795 [Bacillus thuringiensis serovar silo]OTW74272.1 hypothetical protein BK700_01250 [Bacillus thuringiensis serovar toguchini]